MREKEEMRRVVVVVEMVAILGFILSLTPAAINAYTDPNDVSALTDLYMSLYPPPALNKWNANGGDPCGESWKGIKCSGSRVSEIDLSGLGLSGSLGFQLDKLTSLTKFDISHNNFASLLPFQFPQNLEHLNLAHNGFTGQLPYSFSEMTSLKHLDVSHNRFRGQVHVTFSDLTSLSTLDFSFNQLTGNLPGTMSYLISMKNMYLQNNRFTGTINVLANLPLDTLNVENNHLTGWIPARLKGINLRSGGNSWKHGPATPPRTPIAPIRKHKPGGSANQSKA